MKIPFINAFLFMLVLLSYAPVRAQSSADVDPGVKTALARLGDSDAHMRKRGIQDLTDLRRQFPSELILSSLGPSGTQSLLKALGDPEALVRGDAANLLGLLHVAAAVTPVVALLKDPSPSVRQAAATALLYLNDASSTDALMGALDDRSLGVKLAVMRTLGHMQAAQALPILTSLCADPNPRIRAEAVVARSNFKDAALPGILSTALGDGDSNVRMQAFMGLALNANAQANLPQMQAAYEAEKDRATKHTMQKVMTRLARRAGAAPAAAQ